MATATLATTLSLNVALELFTFKYFYHLCAIERSNGATSQVVELQAHFLHLPPSVSAVLPRCVGLRRKEIMQGERKREEMCF